VSIFGKLKGMFGSTAAPLPSAEDLFADRVVAAIAKLPFVTSVRRGQELSLQFLHRGKENNAFLHNLFAETRDLDPAEQAVRIERFARAMTEKVDTISWHDARDRLVPVVRAATFFQGKFDASQGPIRRRFAPFLVTAIGVDSDNSFQYVSHGQVQQWDVDLDKVFATAHDNAARFFDGSDVARYGGGPWKFWHVARDDSYESSRILVPGWLASFAGKVDGRPVAIVPSRSRLIVGGDGDEKGLAELSASAEREYVSSPRRISPAVYTVDAEGAVIPLVLPSTHPLAKQVAGGNEKLAATEYEIQRAHLQEQLGEDVYVAKLSAYERDHDVTTVTTWTEGIPSLLPRAKLVALLPVSGSDDTRHHFTVPWQTLLDVAGDCLRLDPAYELPRWWTDRWPDPVTLEKLRAAAVP